MKSVAGARCIAVHRLDFSESHVTVHVDRPVIPKKEVHLLLSVSTTLNTCTVTFLRLTQYSIVLRFSRTRP
jgi:hypothetical protein